MRRLDEALTDLVERRRAKGPEHLIDSLTRRLAGEAEVVVLSGRTGRGTTQMVGRRRGLAIAAGAMAVAVLVAVPLLVLWGGDGSPVGGTSPAATTLVPPTTTAPPTTAAPGGALPLAPEPTAMSSADIELETCGDSTWAWNENEIWRYSAGVWSLHASAPGRLHDVAYGSGTLWATTDSGLHYLEAGVWHRADFDALPMAERPRWLGGMSQVVAEGDTGIVWLADGDDVFRWDGTSMTNVGHPADDVVGLLAVTDDGTVWAGGFSAWFPHLGALSRYDSTTGTWETVRPLGGEVDLPAGELAPTRDGDLWVVLSDWPDDWWVEETGPPTVAVTLARLDAASGEWAVYDAPPDGGILTMASGAGSLWVAQRVASADGLDEIGRIARLDGETWTYYVEGTDVRDIAVAPDGSVWYTVDGAEWVTIGEALRRLDL
jgi:hypothetical protein